MPTYPPPGSGSILECSAESTFESMLGAELRYHRQMVGMYEWLLAQHKLGALKGEEGEMLRTILMAGLHQMATAYQPKNERER